MKMRKVIYILIITAVMLSFVPLLKIAEYNCPSADDYSYAVTTYKIWNGNVILHDSIYAILCPRAVLV